MYAKPFTYSCNFQTRWVVNVYREKCQVDTLLWCCMLSIEVLLVTLVTLVATVGTVLLPDRRAGHQWSDQVRLTPLQGIFLAIIYTCEVDDYYFKWVEQTNTATSRCAHMPVSQATGKQQRPRRYHYFLEANWHHAHDVHVEVAPCCIRSGIGMAAQ